MQKLTETNSPRWLKDRLSAGYEKLFAYTLRKLAQWKMQDLLNLMIAVFFGYLALNIDSALQSYSAAIQMNGEAGLITRQFKYAGVIFAILTAGSLAGYIKAALLPALQFFGFIVGVCAFVLLGPSDLPPEELWFYILLNYTVLFGFYLWYRFTPNRISEKHSWFSLFILLVLVKAPDIQQQKLVWVIDSVRFIFILSLLTLERKVGISKFRSLEQESAYFFSPAHLITPLPIESIDWKYDPSLNTRLRGLADIFSGWLFLFLAFYLIEYLSSWKQNELTFTETFAFGFLKYIFYYLGSFAWVAIPAGIARWYGVSLPQYFDAPLLATSPFDRWRRWNTYYYNWLNKIIFFPVFKKTKSLAFGVAAVFVMTIFIHHGRVLDGLEFYPKAYFSRALFFTAHGICVYASLKFKNLWPSEHSIKGWWGVLTVTVLMSLIHLLGS